MHNQELDHLKILNIQLSNQIYKLEIAVKQSFLSEDNPLNFCLAKRNKEDQEVYLVSSVKDTINDFSIFEVEISFETFQKDTDIENIWDMYVCKKTEDDILKKRIRSNHQHFSFLSILVEEDKKMFYPFTTNKGNLSFRFNEITLFTVVEDIQMSKDGELYLNGFFNYPLFHNKIEANIKAISLIAVNKDGEERSFDIKQVERQDFPTTYPNNVVFTGNGIEGSVDVGSILNKNSNETYKFFLEIEYEFAGSMERIKSNCITLSHELTNPSHIILKANGKQKKVSYKGTKKANSLILTLKDYNVVKETVSLIRSKWVKIRRSDYLKEMYKVVFYLLGRIMPADQKLVMFESFLGKQYSDSPRAIYEYMLENNPEYKMYWSVDRRHLKFFADKDVKYVRRFSISWLLLMTRAKYWVSNSRLPLWIPKPKHTVYLQTWHGTPLKRLAADMDEVHMPGTNTTKYKENFLREASKWNYLVSPNGYSTEIFRRAFAFDKTMIESGYPRNDFLINCNDMENMNQLKERMNLPKDKKIILYAPTWRDNQFYAKGKYKFDLQLDLDKIREELGEEYIVLLRMHYLVAENLDLSGYEDFVYDFSFHEDIRELYLISDILITDYSSVFFDYANLKRPMLFFVYDIDDYRDNLRGFYFEFEEKAPGPLTRTTEEIIKEIKLIKENGFLPSETTEEFYKKFCYLESGESSKRVVDEVFGK
ncbi:CDP-glycerol glycerophosphotransferase family protein [Pseudalkalibacillus sp. R45]|uniref:CDP-glycerol glycerophosphotransferase family protein n=1 Tax=Pseudalkalibacillus sp. R45 TaxID=3457433 RepID=UPI003FCDF639